MEDPQLSLMRIENRISPSPVYYSLQSLGRLDLLAPSRLSIHPTPSHSSPFTRHFLLFKMSMDPTQSLLRWGIENAAPGSIKQMSEEVQAGKRPDLDTNILKAMMGTSDADRMKECVNVIEGNWVDRDGTGEAKANSEITKEDRYRAWDDLEMVRLASPSLSYRHAHLTPLSQLIEDLDNANGKLLLRFRTTERLLTFLRPRRHAEHASLAADCQALDKRGRRGRQEGVLGMRYRCPEQPQVAKSCASPSPSLPASPSY